MQDKKFHLFTWRECLYRGESHSGISEMYDGSFVSIKDAQKAFESAYFNKWGKLRSGTPDNAEIIEVRDGDIFIVATGLDWGGFKWSVETEQITNAPVKPEPELIYDCNPLKTYVNLAGI